MLVGFIEDGRHSGIDRYLLNFLDTASENGYSVDFITSVYDESLAKKLEKYNSKLFSVPSLKKPVLQYKAIKKLISGGDYSAAYFNISEPLNLCGPLAAKSAGVKVLVHSHNSGIDSCSSLKRSIRKSISFLCRPFLNRACDKRLTCSYPAAKWLFGKKADTAVTIFNAADTKKFCFSEKTRSRVRASFGLSEKDLAVLFVGHLCYQKNPFFLISIFNSIIKLNSSAKCFICGCGHLLPEVEEKVRELGIEKNVIFLGVRNDVQDLMQAFDVFVLPSRFEGLPMVAVEAQMCGLPILMSENITPEAVISDSAKRISLTLSAEVWAKEALALSGKRNLCLDENLKKCFGLESQKNQTKAEILAFGGK